MEALLMTTEQEWVLLTEVYQHDEAQLITALLNMAGIPIRSDRDVAGEIYGLNLGPLARIRLLVPADRLEEAARILDGEDISREE
jgi:hypothetical protein